MDQEMGSKMEFKTRNKQEIRNKMEEMGVNGKQDKRRNIIFQRKTRKTGGKSLKTGKKLKEIQKQDNTRFWRDKISARKDFDKILGNAENRNKNENKVFQCCQAENQTNKSQNQTFIRPYFYQK